MNIEIQHPAGSDDNRIHGYSPIRPHSYHYGVASYSLNDGILKMIHDDSSKSFVVLGKGYTVKERRTDS